MKKLLLLLALLVFPVSAQEDPPLLLFTKGDPQAAITIHVLNAETGEEQFITELAPPDSPTGHDFGWSPDGRVWVMDVGAERKRHLSFYDVKNGEKELFGEQLDFRTCASAIDWSPDGRYLSYSTATDDQAEGLTIYDTQNDTGYTLPWIGQHFPYWSPDGNFMLILDNYFTLDTGVNDEKTRLLRTDDGTELLRRGTDANAFNFAFSPDSRFFAYEEDESAWLYNLTTDETINLDVPADTLRWSPTGRYLVIYTFQEGVPYAAPEFSYDTQTGQLDTFNFDNPGNFAAWADDENTFLLRTDFWDLTDSPVPKRLITYDLATADVETIIEAEMDSWVGEVSRNGDWIAALRYHPSETDEGQWLSEIHFINGETVIEAEINLKSLVPALYTDLLSWSPDGRRLIVNTDDGLYHFDSNTASFEDVSPDDNSADNLFWSADSHYLAFQSGQTFTLWDAPTDTIAPLPEGISAIIGWQHSDKQASLACLRGYSDGNV